MSGEPKVRPALNPSARSSARLGLGEVDIITPGIIHVRVAGAIRPEHIEPIMQAGDEQIAMGYRVLIAIDADDVHGYKSEVRTIFKLGISLANAFTGGMLRSFSDPEEFDAELSQAARKAQNGWLGEARH